MFKKFSEAELQQMGEAVLSYLKGLSIESTPKGVKKVDHSTILPANTPVYITHLGGEKPEAMADAAAKLRDEGMVPVPHIGARNLKGMDELEDILTRCCERAKLDNVLLIGGSSKKPGGDVTETLQVMQSGLLESCGIKRVGLAGHPEGSPDFSDQVALKALHDKISYGREAGFEVRVLTQFLFKEKPVIRWGEALKNEHGLSVPVHVGLAGPTNVKQLVRYASMCGVGPSMKVLTRNPMNYLRYLSRPYTPAGMLLSLAWYAHQNPQSNLCAPPHFYSLGGMKRCARWVKAIQEGAFNVKPSPWPRLSQRAHLKVDW